MNSELMNKMPSFLELVKIYGAYIALLIIVVIYVFWMQRNSYKKILNSKESEIKRLVEREEALNSRIMVMIDKEIGMKQIKK